MRLRPPSPRRLRAATVVLALCVLTASASLGCSGEAKAARGMEIAIQDDPVFVLKAYFNRPRAYRIARSLGVTRQRMNVNWAYLLTKRQRKAKRKPVNVFYNFTLLDSAVESSLRAGIRVQLSLTGPVPAWAAGNRKLGVVRPNAKLYGQFAAIVADRYKGRVDRYSIWNEPNWYTWLRPLRSSASIYRKLYIRGYDAIKTIDPRAKVLIGETAPYRRPGKSIAPLSWLRRVACVNKRYKRTSSRCPRLKADGYAHHPYDFKHHPSYRFPGRDNVTIGTLSRLTRALDRLSRAGALRKRGGGRMPLYLTEYGYFASTGRKLSPRKSAAYLKAGFKIALRNRRVRSQLQYLLVSPPKSKPYAFFDLGLMNRSGRKHSTFRALKSFYRQHRRSLKRPGRAIRVKPR